MTKRTKRFIAGLLTAAMVIGTFTFVSATELDGTGDNGYEATVSGDSVTSTPKIKIVVPTDAKFIINPYKIDYKSEDGSISGNMAIVSAKNTVINKSEVPVAVSVEELVVDNGNYDKDAKAYDSKITVMSGSARKAKAKSINLFMRMATNKEAAVKVDGIDTFKLPADLTKTPAKGTVKDIKATAKYTTKFDKNGQNVKAAGGSLKNAIVLGAGTWENDAYVDGTGQAVEYILMGDVNANPTKVDENKKTVPDPWTAADDGNLKVSYKFTFEPQSLEPKSN
jgi:phosphotransferase system HPr-like phosphotransfer protein